MSNSIIELKRELTSQRKAIKEVEPMLQFFREQLHLKDESYYNILIALTEAVNNAIIHGNRCDPDKKVVIDIKADESGLEIIVTDEGKGFNPDNVEDPRSPENLLKTSGRGIFLIKELSLNSSYSFTESGTTVFIKFRFEKE